MNATHFPADMNRYADVLEDEVAVRAGPSGKGAGDGNIGRE